MRSKHSEHDFTPEERDRLADAMFQEMKRKIPANPANIAVMHIVLAVLSAVGGGLLVWLVLRIVVDPAALREISPTFWALIVGMAFVGVGLLLIADVLLVEASVVD